MIIQIMKTVVRRIHLKKYFLILLMNQQSNIGNGKLMKENILFNKSLIKELLKVE